MRVLQLGPYPPPHGGVQANLVAIRDFLRIRGISCAVINLTRFRPPQDADDVYYPRSAPALVRLLLTLRYDILHLHLGGELTPRLLALSLVCCSIPGKRAVVSLHSGGYPSSPKGLATHPWSWRSLVLRRFDRAIGINPEIVGWLQQKCGIPESRLRFIYPHELGVPTEDPMPDELGTFFAAHDPVLLTVGLLEPEYDLGQQIDVLGFVREHSPRAGLVIIGSGGLEHELGKRIAQKPYGSHILLCGDVPHSVTLRAIADCDIFLRTTLYDGDSISVREAIHLGTPVVATDNGMRPKGCDLVPISDLAALRVAIEKRFANLPAKQRSAQHDDQNIKRVFELYREIM